MISEYKTARYEDGFLDFNKQSTLKWPWVVVKNGEILKKSNGAIVRFSDLDAAETKVVQLIAQELKSLKTV